MGAMAQETTHPPLKWRATAPMASLIRMTRWPAVKSIPPPTDLLPGACRMGYF
jgi:hypothetical protein